MDVDEGEEEEEMVTVDMAAGWKQTPWADLQWEDDEDNEDDEEDEGDKEANREVGEVVYELTKLLMDRKPQENGEEEDG